MNKEFTAVIPLESNPDVFDKFAYNLGLLKSYSFNDIFSIDDPSLLDFLPRPMVAIVLLFPIQKVKPALSSSSMETVTSSSSSAQPIWLKQNFQNACGLYALLHILINNKHLLQNGSPLTEYIDTCGTTTRKQQNIDQFIINFTNQFNNDFTNNSGETSNPNPTDQIDLHFISFISYNGQLWEMDGRAHDSKPLCLGNIDSKISSQNNSGNDEIDLIDQPRILQRIKAYMNNVESENDKLNFSLLGLSRSWD